MHYLGKTNVLPSMVLLLLEEVGKKYLLYALDGVDVSLSFKLEFSCSNNEAKDEALFIR